MPEAVIRWCEHGETVRGMETTRGCSGCLNGICGAALACMQPDEDPKPAPPSSRFPFDFIVCAIGGAAGLIAAAFYAWPLIF